MVVEKEMKHQKKEEGPRVSRLKSFADNPKMICMKSYENDFHRFFFVDLSFYKQELEIFKDSFTLQYSSTIYKLQTDIK